PMDPALYLEMRENGDELEIEPKLLLAHRRGIWVGAFNLVGEYETHHAGDEKGETEKRFRTTLGITREFGAHLAFGVEGLYERALEESEGNPSAIFAGPTINVQSAEVQVALGWQPQLWGDPTSSGGLALDHFPRSEFRLILGFDL